MDGNIGFNDVGGLQENIQCLKEMILFPLIYKEFYEKVKIKPPRGVLFYGPPGTGKTLLACALANECGRANRKVSFFTRKGAECLTKWVGESERHLRTLFQKAEELNPSIIFFDEIDGLAPIRTANFDQVHVSVVTTLLALMDGLNTKGQVVVIGATNRIDSIDPALRRSGRFDRELYFPLPAFKARNEILLVHTGHLSEQICLPYIRHLAATTEGYCGSDLQALCSEAVMCSIRRQFPQMYSSDRPIEFNISTLKVERRDFKKAKSTIVSAASRVSYTPSRRLSSKTRPLLSRILCKAMTAMRKVSHAPFLHARKGHRRHLSQNDASSSKQTSKADWGEGSSRNGGICPHFLIVGSAQQGHTDYLAPAMLHWLEDLPITTLDITTLFEASGRTPEEACIQKMKEARQSFPGVLYMPDISGWWDLVNEAARAVFITMVREFEACDFPILLLASSHTPYGTLSQEIQKIFSIFEGRVFVMENPSEKDRSEFFGRLFIKKALKPPFMDHVSNSNQRQVLLCKIPENSQVSTEQCASPKLRITRRKNSKKNNQSSEVQSTSITNTENKRKLEKTDNSSPMKRMKVDRINQNNKHAITNVKNCDENFETRSILMTASKHRVKMHPPVRITRNTAVRHHIGYKYKKMPSNFHENHQFRKIPQDEDCQSDCDEIDDILSCSSSSSSCIDEGEIPAKNEKKGKSETLKIDKNTLENLLKRAVAITNDCTVHTILMLHSKLMLCIHKYKYIWDRSQLTETEDPILPENYVLDVLFIFEKWK